MNLKKTFCNIVTYKIQVNNNVFHSGMMNMIMAELCGAHIIIENFRNVWNNQVEFSK
jgi:hypothetical protein